MITPVHQVGSISIVVALPLFVILLVLSCNQVEQYKSTSELEGPHVLTELIVTDPSQGLAYFKGELFTGYAVQFNSQKLFTSKEGYVNGIKSGESLKWFDNGQLSYQCYYQNGQLHGTATSWWSNGQKRSENYMVDGLGQGYQTQWYRSGALFKRIHLLNGNEDGIQQSWRENGKLYNNYEAKNGRIFGLKRSKLCFQLDSQDVKFVNENTESFQSSQSMTPDL